MRLNRRSALLLAALALAGCSKTEPSSSTSSTTSTTATTAATSTATRSTPEPAPSTKVLTVGTDAAYAPFESQDAQGRIVGFDMDVVSLLAAKAGLQIKFVNTPWEGIFNALAQGDRDLLVSAITITPERQQTMDFSDPYFEAKQLIAVRNDSKVNGFAALKPLKVGVQNGTTGDEVTSKLLGKTSPAIRRFESTPLALKELEAGGVDAVVADNGVVVHYVANNSGAKFKTVDDPTFQPEYYGIAVRKGNAALADALSKALTAARADGSYDKLYASYFGTPPPALPGATPPPALPGATPPVGAAVGVTSPATATALPSATAASK